MNDSESESTRPTRQTVVLVGVTLVLTIGIGVVGFFMLGFSTLGCQNVSGVNAAMYGWLAMCLGVGVYTAITFLRQKSSRTTGRSFALLVGLDVVALVLSFVGLIVACG